MACANQLDLITKSVTIYIGAKTVHDAPVPSGRRRAGRKQQNIAERASAAWVRTLLQANAGPQGWRRRGVAEPLASNKITLLGSIRDTAGINASYHLMRHVSEFENAIFNALRILTNGPCVKFQVVHHEWVGLHFNHTMRRPKHDTDPNVHLQTFRTPSFG